MFPFSFEEEEEESHHPCFPLLCKNHVFEIMHAIIMFSAKSIKLLRLCSTHHSYLKMIGT
jgi:hypothetical protein